MIGLQIRKRVHKTGAELVEQLARLPVANISDVMARLTAGGARLRPLHDGSPMAGPAITVRCPPGDNLFVHKALDLAEPGDIVVVDAGGDLTNAIIGEMMLAHARRRKLGGIVINGAIRDLAAIRANPLPVYAAGVTHRGPYKNGPGEINVPIAIDGMVIEPGDVIVGDEDGLLCVPFSAAAEVLAKAKSKHAAEQAQAAKIDAGTNDRTWIDKVLADLGCRIES